MNRQVARYSAFASIVVAAVLGIVYFAFLSGTQADDGSTEVSAADSASASASDEDSSQPDTLFREPAQRLGTRQTQDVTNPFASRSSDVLQTAYGDAEPRRLPVNPNANPLPGAELPQYGNRSQSTARLTAGGQVVASDNDSPAADARNDYLGLHNASPESPAELSHPQAPATASAAKKGAPARKTVASQQHTANSQPGRSARQSAGAGLQTTDASPLRAAPPASGTDLSASAADLPSVLEQAPRSRGATANAQDNLQEPISRYNDSGYGALGSTAQSGAIKPGSGYSASNANDDVAPGNAYADQFNAANDATNSPPSAADQFATPSLATRRNATGPAGRELLTPPADYDPIAGGARPGSRQVEGQQVPQITIEKTAPQEVQVGKAARFELHLRNTGTVVAQGVEVHDFVPEGTQFVSANPPATPNARGELVWTLGALKPGDEATIEVELTPITEGEVGSVAFVTLRAEAGARSRVTRPDLTLQVTAAKQVMIGSDVQLSIKVGNPGTGPATGVVIEEHVPPGLKHAAGAELEFEVGTLKPGETRELELTLTAAQAGRLVNQLVVRADGNLHEEAQCELEVIAPALAITMEGPSKRYLERQATYTVSVSNPGTAPAKDVELVTRLPKGLKFVKANNAGHYDPQAHAVVWSLEELPPEETGTVMLTAIPVEPGEQVLRAEGRAKQNLADEEVQRTVVEGLAALLFEVIDVADPIEVKGETQYQIRVMNQGSKAADNVRLAALLPPELKFVSADGPTRHINKGQQVIFEPLGRLAPKADTAYRIVVQGVQPGDVRMKIQLQAEDLEQPIMKEESTRVYSDE
jgi:uncharacterized repeat protein (TIGR01451 family)